ncbi:MAG: DUF3761 domain-containing protein [Acidobacteriota bacterium]
MMTKRLIQSALVMAGLFAVQNATAQAPAGATALCKDGTYYSGQKKQGACRGHQGIKEWYGTTSNGDKKAGRGRVKSAPAESPQAAPATAGASAPAGASALCKDGTYYSGEKKQGACRGHQGIKEWYGTAASSGKAVAPAHEAPTPAATSRPAPASSTNQRPADATGLCNDGTYYTGATKRGACGGHKGVKDWYGASTSAGKSPATLEQPASTTPSKASPASSASAPPAPAQTAPANRPDTGSVTPAPGGGANKVWLNTASNVYHCSGSRYYGTTKAGAYMTEAEAKAKGGRPDHGKPCE